MPYIYACFFFIPFQCIFWVQYSSYMSIYKYICVFIYTHIRNVTWDYICKQHFEAHSVIFSGLTVAGLVRLVHGPARKIGKFSFSRVHILQGENEEDSVDAVNHSKWVWPLKWRLSETDFEIPHIHMHSALARKAKIVKANGKKKNAAQVRSWHFFHILKINGEVNEWRKMATEQPSWASLTRQKKQYIEIS